jgi:cysteine-rich repeat protein
MRLLLGGLVVVLVSCGAVNSDPRCGDGFLAAGEDCDDSNNEDGDGCSADCQDEVASDCGNGVREGGEACDDGNASDTDACLGTCRNASCGDNHVQASVEQCDDGNASPDDGCSPDCNIEASANCGDGLLDDGEVCDDDNNSDGDGCAANCRSDETCGNSLVDVAAGEVCDDGLNVDGDGCSANCRSNETCGNFVIDAVTSELCDDGNNEDGDGCSADCKSGETCGNGIVDTGAGETCDDNNMESDDGCSSTCQVEGTGAIAEVEPNDNPTTTVCNCLGGDGFDPTRAQGVFDADVVIQAAISPAGDEDVFSIYNPNIVARNVVVSTWGPDGVGTCDGFPDTWMNIKDGDGTNVVPGNDNGPVGGCSQITYALPPGTIVYVQVLDYGDDMTYDKYFVQIDFD